jgi:CrcB protein
MNMILAIASGGAIGAVLRHFFGVLALHLGGSHFPWGTLGVNIIGSFLMGVLVALFALHWNPPQEIRAFLTVGMLGAFTTFSTFSLDVMTLWERGDVMTTAAYITASVTLSIAALFTGMMIMRQVFA